MSWAKVDDKLWSANKWATASLRARGLWVTALSYCMDRLTDGVVLEASLPMLRGTKRDAGELVAAGLWEEIEGGWQFHDWFEYQPSKAQISADRAAAAIRQLLSRNPKLRDEIKARDGDRCRYCGTQVRWNDRRGTAGGTMDLVDPDEQPTLGNLVVCCRGCQIKKGGLSLDQSGMNFYSDLDQTQIGPSESPVSSGIPYPYPLYTDLANARSGASAATDPPPDAEPQMSSSALSAGDPKPETAQTLIGEWVERCSERPPDQVIGQAAKLLKSLLDQGYAYADVRRALAEMHKRSLHPSTLPALLNEILNPPTGSRASAARPSTTDARVGAALDLSARYEAIEAAELTAAEAQPELLLEGPRP